MGFHPHLATVNVSLGHGAIDLRDATNSQKTHRRDVLNKRKYLLVVG